MADPNPAPDSPPKITDPQTVAIEQVGDVLKNIVGNLNGHPIFVFGIGAMLLAVLAFGALLFKPDVLDRAPVFQWFPAILLGFGLLLVGIEVWAGLRRQRLQAKPGTPPPPPTEEPVSPAGEEEAKEPSMPVKPALVPPDTLGRRYLQKLYDDLRLLQLRGIDPAAVQAGKETLSLDAVYIALNTTTSLEPTAPKDTMPGERERRPLTALQAVDRARCAVLRGDPGSGKSTFVNYLAWCLAGERLHHDGRLVPYLGDDWHHGALLPVRVLLREFAAWSGLAGAERGQAAHLWSFFHEWLQRLGWQAFFPALQARLMAEDQAILLLDGLDEVPLTQYDRVRQAVAAFAGSVGARVLVTSRVYAYDPVDPDKRLKGFDPAHTHTLDNFNEEQIDKFLDRWFEAAVAARWFDDRLAKEKAGRLKTVVRRQDLIHLAQRPLLLTLIAILESSGGKLPDDRVDLYNSIVELLLRRWNEAKEEGGKMEPGLIERLDVPGLTMVHIRRAIQKTAFRVHQAHGDEPGEANIEEPDLLEDLCGLLQDSRDKAAVVVEYIEKRAGLLLGLGRRELDSPRVYAFPHRTFQEYLAGCHLVERDDFSAQAARLAADHPGRWREVFVLAARQAKAARGVAAVQKLCPEKVEDRPRPPATDEKVWLAPVIAGEALLEVGTADVRAERDGPTLLRRLDGWLAALAQTEGALSLAERHRAAEVRDALTGEKDLLNELSTWIRIPGGADDGRDLWVGQYPVTNLQFKQFIAAGGYENPDWWSGDGWKWRTTEYNPEWRGEGPVTQPEYWQDPRLNRNGYPVVGVSYYEAEAYCRWLTALLGGEIEVDEVDEVNEVNEAAHLLVADLLPGKAREARLLTDGEWTRAAGGEGKGRYPWDAPEGPATKDERAILARANTDEAGLGGPTPVRMYPLGAGRPHGLMDMAGNVWEWLVSEHKDYKGARVLRGGSWYSNQDYARCAARCWYFPHYSYGFIGFRLASPACSDF